MNSEVRDIELEKEEIIKQNSLMVHFSSDDQAWETPQDFYDQLNKEFNFTLDPCCTPQSAKCKIWFTKEDDGLNRNWMNHTVFMNPPYGREIKHWIKKAHDEFLKGSCTVVCLIPARTDTIYWHDHIFPLYYENKIEIRFLKGRLKFGSDMHWQKIWDQEFIDGKKNNLYKKYGQKNPAPFPSALVIFKNGS